MNSEEFLGAVSVITAGFLQGLRRTGAPNITLDISELETWEGGNAETGPILYEGHRSVTVFVEYDPNMWVDYDTFENAMIDVVRELPYSDFEIGAEVDDDDPSFKDYTRWYVAYGWDWSV